MNHHSAELACADAPSATIAGFFINPDYACVFILS
jgi:hypothetical protein